MQTQHTCILLEDVTAACNLTCPTCFADSSPSLHGFVPVAQVLANVAAWERGWKGHPTSPVDWSRVNVNGSSVAVGHPWAATGGRILATLAYEMARRDARRGLISICAAGGMAGAFLLTRS